MEESNKRGKYVLLASFMFSTFNFNHHINTFMIGIVWSIIFSSDNSHSITHYISTILVFALGSTFVQWKQLQRYIGFKNYVRSFYFFSCFSCDGDILILARWISFVKFWCNFLDIDRPSLNVKKRLQNICRTPGIPCSKFAFCS